MACVFVRSDALIAMPTTRSHMQLLSMQALLAFLALASVNSFSFVPWSRVVQRIQQESPVIATEVQHPRQSALFGKPDLFSGKLYRLLGRTLLN